jgi:hypothetical protein
VRQAEQAPHDEAPLGDEKALLAQSRRFADAGVVSQARVAAVGDPDDVHA